MTVARLSPLPLLLLAGCATRAVTPIQSPLQGAIKAQEVTEDGAILEVPLAGMVEVDVNSVVRLEMSKEAIQAQMAGVAEGVDKLRYDRLAGQIELARRALEAQRRALDAIRDIGKETPGTDGYEAAVARRGKLAEEAQIKLAELVKSRGKDLESLLRVGRAADLIAEEGKSIEAEVAATLNDLQGVLWRIQAQLTTKGKSTPIHLPNYDRLASGDPKLLDKRIPVMTDEVRRQYELARQMAAAADDVRATVKTVLADLKVTLDKAATGIVSSAEALKRLRSLGASLKDSTDPKTRALGQSILAQEATIGALADRCSSSAARLVAARDGGDDLFMAAALAAATTCAGPLLEAWPKIQDIAQKLDAVLHDPQSMAAVGEGVRKELSDLAIVGRLDATIRPLKDTIEALVGAVRTHVPSRRVLAPSDVLDRPFREVMDTVIDLTRTERAENDFVSFQPAIVKGGEVVVDGVPVTMKVVRTGGHVNLSAALFFVGPLGETRDEPQFVPAPAVTTAAHYRVSRASGEASPRGLGAAWNFADPGIGVHVVTLALGKAPGDDGEAQGADQIEIGLGGTVQLFGDLAQVGIGYDLQAERGYYFLGFGLQTATDFGIAFPAASAPKTSAQP